jgi:hypothetical protein
MNTIQPSSFLATSLHCSMSSHHTEAESQKSLSFAILIDSSTDEDLITVATGQNISSL